MFKPLPMQLISLKLLAEDVPLAAPLLAKSGVFNPEINASLADSSPESSAEEFAQQFNSAHNRLKKILQRLSLSSSFLLASETKASVGKIQERVGETSPPEPVELTQLTTLNTQLGKLWQKVCRLDDNYHQFHESKIASKQLLDTLQQFTNLDLDLKLFHDKKRFLNLHIGAVPILNLAHFEESITLAQHFIRVFHQDEKTASLVIAGPLEQEEQVRAVLEHADFKPLTLPPQFHDHPQRVHVELTAEVDQWQSQMNWIIGKKQKLATENQAFLQQACLTLNRAAAYAKLTETVRGRGQLAIIEGWIPQADLPQLQTTLETQLNRPFVLNTRKPERWEYPQVPSLIRHPRLLAPFVALVKNYGIPRYGEFDPTLLFAITFILMFGTMFGDVGHGALIALAGWYWRKKLTTFTPFLIMAGLSSILFGFLYGSIFGFEEVLLPALWMSPIHHPNLMLTIALYWGIGFILLATLITIINRWQEGDYKAAIFNNTGIMGIFLYLGGFYAAYQWMTKDIFELDQQLAIFIPLIIILSYKWHENKLSFGERLLVTLIEGLESIINYLANTLSFLRVAAFSLNHAALAIAVFTLANMMGTPADWLVIILGNLFIVILEGAIVTIQVLRLEYYEGFSRFFRGDGRAFQPLINNGEL